MPLYPIHGFKWDRVSIIKHINYNHVHCASPSWIMLDRSSSALLANFRKLWPELMTRTKWQRERKFNGLLHNGDSDRGISGELGELSEGEGGDESG